MLDGKNTIYVYENTMDIMRDHHMHSSLVVAKVPENEKKLHCLLKKYLKELFLRSFAESKSSQTH